MKNKQLIILWLFLLFPLITLAQNTYVVSKVSGGVQKITDRGKQRLYKGEVLKGDVTLNISFTGSLTILAEGSDKQYVINSPGKAKLESLIADKRNTVLTLTKDYVKSVVAQLRQEKVVKTRRYSDPATVTREVFEKDSLLAVKDSAVVLENEIDTTQCQH